MNNKHYPLRAETIEKISQAQRPVDLPIRRQLENALTTAQEIMIRAYADNQGDLWVKAWRRAEEVRSQMLQ